MRKNLLTLFIAIITAAALGFGAWFVVNAYQDKDANSMIGKVMAFINPASTGNDASNGNNAGKNDSTVNAEFGKADRNKNVCKPTNGGKKSGIYYDCFGPESLSLKDEDGKQQYPTPDMQLIMNSVNQYKQLKDINNCAKEYNYNANCMFKEKYDECGFGWYYDGNGLLTAIYPDENGNPVTVTQNMRKNDDGNEFTVDIPSASWYKMRFDYKDMITIANKKAADINDCMKTSGYDVDAAERKCNSYGVYSQKDDICTLMPNTYGDNVHTDKQNVITVRVSQDENLLSVCAYDEQKALEEAKKKSAKQTAQADKPVLDAQGHDIRDINVIVEEVIEGKYANGDERVKLLGDRYNAVQDAVNQKCIVEKDARCAFN